MTLSWLQILLLALLEGLVGVLPVSDSGAMLAARKLFGLPLNGSGDEFYTGLCQLACAAAICIVYRREVIACFRRPRGRHPDEASLLGRRQWMLVLISLVFSLPALLFGWNIAWGTQLTTVGFLLLVNGFVLYLGDRVSRGAKELPSATLGDGAVMGAAQGLSVIPGFSRVGFTMTAGILWGLTPDYSLCFSCLAAVPFLFLRACILLIRSVKPDGGVGACLLGMLICGSVAYLALRLFRFAVRKGSSGSFCFISWGAGLFMLLLYLIS